MTLPLHRHTKPFTANGAFHLVSPSPIAGGEGGVGVRR